MASIEFTIPGRPATKGSSRSFKSKTTGKQVHVPDCEKLRTWTGRAAEIAISAMKGQPPWRGPVLMHVDWEFDRPAKHYRSNNREKDLRDDAPDWHYQKPDEDKITRALFDALKGIVYVDDCQVCGGTRAKRWADEGAAACTRVMVEFE